MLGYIAACALLILIGVGWIILAADALWPRRKR